jgi:hypothetical protein
MNLTIIVSSMSDNDRNLVYSTRYNRWQQPHREYIFKNLHFTKIPNEDLMFKFAVPKADSALDNVILTKLSSNRKVLKFYLSNNKHQKTNILHYRTAGGRYFKIFTDRDFGTDSKSNKAKPFQLQYDVYAIISVLSSNLWWLYYTLHFDMYNCKDYMMYSFPFDYDKCGTISELVTLGRYICDFMYKKAERKVQNYQTTGVREQLIFKPSVAKSIIDQIDTILAEHYGFTEEELDYIINYDIKYRMGIDGEASDDE